MAMMRHNLGSKASMEIEAMLTAKHPLGKRPMTAKYPPREIYGSSKASATKVEQQRQSIRQDNPNDVTVWPTIVKTNDKDVHRHNREL